MVGYRDGCSRYCNELQILSAGAFDHQGQFHLCSRKSQIRFNLDADGFGSPKIKSESISIFRAVIIEEAAILRCGSGLTHLEITGRNLNIRVDANTIAGTLLDNFGAVVPNAAVTLSGLIEDRNTTTGAQGRFRFVDLPRGTYVVSVLGGRMRNSNYQLSVRTLLALTLSTAEMNLSCQRFVKVAKVEMCKPHQNQGH